jgi:hypothetical protein
MRTAALMWTVSMIGERRLAFVVLNETSTTTIMYHITSKFIFT